jgi:hypothetical protein
MSLLRDEREVIRRGEHYCIELTPDQVKTDQADCFDLPDVLSPLYPALSRVHRHAIVTTADLGAAVLNITTSPHGPPSATHALGVTRGGVHRLVLAGGMRRHPSQASLIDL